MSKIKVMIPCEEASQTCDKSQYNEVSIWDKIKLNLHLIYCRTCRKYTKNNSRLSRIIKLANVKCLDRDCKEAMRKDLENAIKDHSN